MSGNVINPNKLPSYVDDVIECYSYMGNTTVFYTGEGGGPATIVPEKGKIYVDLTTEKIYRWGGLQYICISDVNDDANVPIYDSFAELSGQYKGHSSNWEATYNSYASLSSQYLTDQDLPDVSSFESHISDSTIHVTSSEKSTWNAKQNALSNSNKLPSGYVNLPPWPVAQTVNDSTITFTKNGIAIPSGSFTLNQSSNKTIDIPVIEGGSTSNASIDYLLFKMPNNTDSNVYYDFTLTFAGTDAIGSNNVVKTLINDASNFSYGNESMSAFEPITMYSETGIPMQLSNCVLRYNLTSLKANAVTSGFNRFTYQWVAHNLGRTETASGVLGFGMTEGTVQIFDNDFDSLNDSIAGLNQRVTALENDSGSSGDSGTGLTPVFVPGSNSNYTMSASNKWYLCLTSGVQLIYMPTSNLITGDIVKLTVNSTVLSGSSGTVHLFGAIYGEGTNGWDQIAVASGTPLEIDVPQTMTFIYQGAGNGLTARWNLVESNRL